MERRRFPLNAPGDFYVEDGMCMACTAPEHEAPEVLTHQLDSSGKYYHCYFFRQPNTPQELERAMRAVEVGCCAGVRYGGRDPQVIRRLSHLVPDTIDNHN